MAKPLGGRLADRRAKSVGYSLVTVHTALPAAATLLSAAFAMSTFERWVARRRPHELVWTISLVMFALGSACLWLGGAIGWSEWTFKGFYLFGAILNVPYLALGTVYLLGGRRWGDPSTAVVSLLAAFAAGVVVAVPPVAAIGGSVLPQGSTVFSVGPRVAAGVGSGVAATVIFAGAIWSAVRLLRSRRHATPTPPGGLSPGRLAAANLFIAAGTLILSAGGILNSAIDAMNAFAVSLVVGIAVIFVGFLLTNTGPTRADDRVRGSLGAGPLPQGAAQQLASDVVR
jgi:hypothetical protein